MSGMFLKHMTKDARHAYSNFVTIFTLSRQIRAIRKQRGWTQRELAEKSGLGVLTIWRVEKYLGCLHSSLSTLTAVAAAFDVALQVRFISWGEWVTVYITPDGIWMNEGLCPEAMSPRPFHEDLAFLQSSKESR